MSTITYGTAGSNLYICTSGTGTSTITAASLTVPASYRQREYSPPQPLKISQMQGLKLGHLDDLSDLTVDPGIIEIPAHRTPSLQWYKIDPNTVLQLPDGTIIDIEDEYRWKVYENNAQVTREACRISAFNRFINASELLESFITDMAPSGIKQNQVLKVPVEAFINWLIYKAADADGEQLRISRWNHKCGYCMRFLPKRLVTQGVNFCNSLHLDKFLQRQDNQFLQLLAFD